MATPTAEQQIEFLERLQRLLSEGIFQATYKYALLHAVADLCLVHGDDSGAPLVLDTNLIAERFIELYWPQARPYPTPVGGAVGLKQNKGAVAKVIKEIRKTQAVWASPASLRQDRGEWSKLVDQVAGVVKSQPMTYLENVGGQWLNLLYAETPGWKRSITLFPGVAYCLRAFYPLVTDLVRGAWVRYIRRYNGEHLGATGDLVDFLFGSERTDLSGYREVLSVVDGQHCFYCERRLVGTAEVDHFIPWARWPVDLGHNFVLAHRGCNNDKSDYLAAERHLERWVRRNQQRGDDLAAEFSARGLPASLTATASVARWAYAQTARVQGLTWVRKEVLEPLTTTWSSLLVA